MDSTEAVRKSLAQQEEYRVRDRDGDRMREPDIVRAPDTGPRTEAGRRVMLDSQLFRTQDGWERLRRHVLAIEAEAALLARPVTLAPQANDFETGPSVSLAGQANDSADYAELERLARAATPSPWFSQPSEHEPPLGVVYGPDGDSFASIAWNPGNDYDPVATAEYIAACSPATVLALLARRAPGDRDAAIAAIRESHDTARRRHAAAPTGYPDHAHCETCAVLRALAADSRPEQPAPSIHSHPPTVLREHAAAARPEEPPE